MFTRTGWTRWIVLGLVIALLVTLTGCAASSGGFPPRSEDEKADLRALEGQYKSSDRITKHYALEAAKRVEDRNDFVTGRMALIDANYKMFVRDFVLEKQEGDTATDITIIGLNSAGALIVPSSTTRILAAISAGITGSKASFDKNFYYEQTAKALYTAMNAQRKDVRARIANGLKSSEMDYPFNQALGDLDDYYMAGTFLGGLQAIQRDAGVKDANAQKKLDDIRGYYQTPVPMTLADKVAAIAFAISNTDAGKNKILEQLSADELKTLVLAVDAHAGPEAYADARSARAWLIGVKGKARTEEGAPDAQKIDALHDALKTAKLVQ